MADGVWQQLSLSRRIKPQFVTQDIDTSLPTWTPLQTAVFTKSITFDVENICNYLFYYYWKVYSIEYQGRKTARSSKLRETETENSWVSEITSARRTASARRSWLVARRT